MSEGTKIYADNAATTRVSDEALEAMLPFFKERYGNASSLYELGTNAKQALEDAREQVAAALGAEPREIFFTSGGSESDNWFIKGMAAAQGAKGKKHIVSTRFEHHAVLRPLNTLKKQGFDVTFLDVHEDGIIRLEELKAALRDDAAFVTVMYANNEVGSIQPIAEIGEICKERGIPFHTDAVQAVGHIPVDVNRDHIDALSLSAHKFYGPKGVGALYLRRSVRPQGFIEGGDQESGRRAGTENVAGIVGMATALTAAMKEQLTEIPRVSALRDKLIAGGLQIERSRLNGHPTKRLPGNVNMCFEGVEGESLLLMLDLQGVSASSGSACSSGSLEPSHVLLSLGLPAEVAHGSLRLTLGRYNTESDIDHILKVLPGIVQRLRDMSPLWDRIQANN